jgi:antibiotic biosynthesis monooxygenase (ABM) superfamily enzyme
MPMFIRCAFFSGRVKPGREAEFTAYVRDKLVPLWTRFPGAEEVRVLRQEESDSDAQRYEMVLAIRYPSRAAIEEALASPVRFESREVTKGLTEMFDGSIFHTVFKADDFALPTD